jgi:histidinol-phosphate aminotransferase
MKISVPEHIMAIEPYQPGKPLEELEREYGITDSIKLASNENPAGPSPMAVAAIGKHLKDLHRYPDGSGHILIRQLSEHLCVEPENIVLGNGSDEIIGLLAHSLLGPGDEVILPRPSFLMYDITVRSVGAVPAYVPLASLSIDLNGIREKISPRTRMIFLCNPNNPTGTVFSKTDFDGFLEAVPPEVVVVIDEAYIEFVRDQECARGIDYLDSGRNIVMLRTFSKAYGLAGLRIGYGIMPGALSGILNRIRPPFNVNSLAQIGAVAALKDTVFVQNTIDLVHDGLDFLYNKLAGLGLEYFPTQANFFLINVQTDADAVFERMLRQGVIVRSMLSYGYPRYIRVNVGLHRENVRLIEALDKAVK